MRSAKAPADFVCPYRRGCPHMQGLSAPWAFRTVQDQWRLEDQVRTLEADNHHLRTENEDLRVEIAQIKAQFTALHRKQFKANARQASPCTPERSPPPKKRGAPVGHPPWSRPVPTRVDQTVTVAAPTVCPHCAGEALAPSAESIEHIQEDIVIRPQTLVTRFQHATAFCPRCRRPVYATAPGELRNCAIGPTTNPSFAIRG